MVRSLVRDTEIKVLLRGALTDRVRDRALFMRGVDGSYSYEGYGSFKAEDLSAGS